MEMTNQQMGTGVQQFKFTPIATSFTNVGTTVTYGIQSSGINAYNPSIGISGNIGNYTQSPWNAMTYANVQPLISSGQYSMPGSGVFFGHQQPYQYWQTGWSTMLQPSVDISETSSDVVVSAYVPNVNLNNLSLNVTENSVTISASAWTGNHNVVINRTVALPTSIRAESVDASMQNSGVLEIRMPKSEKNVRHRSTISPGGTQTGL